MNFRRFSLVASFIFALLIVNTTATADLLIYPVRVSFDETERSASLTLTNTSSKTNTYRLQWSEKRALAEGGYDAVSEEEAETLPIASKMLRFSPRQVTLKPGERQLIKIALRRPRDLAEGEYRSHLLFKAVRPEEESGSATSTSTSINIVLSFAVPVTVQQGNYDTQVSLKTAIISYNPEEASRKITLDLAREGLHSASGDISAFWTAEGKEEVLLGKIADYNLWTELKETKTSLISTEADFTPTNGRLRVHYEGVRDYRGITYIDEILDLKRSDIIIEKISQN